MLRLSNVVKHYPTATTTVQALRGVSLAFREHEFVAILGPSGCGKTTMLNIIGGLDRYTDGDLVIGGVSTASFDDLHWDAYRNATIGFVFQSYNLIPHLTVLENVEMGLCLAGKKKKERRAKAVAALHRVGMGDEINKKPNQLSGGQMQRVAIARALVTEPKIILADEPTGALDSELSVQVMDLLKEISETHLVIMVTHNAELADTYCSRICRFKDGQLISDSNPYSFEEEDRELAASGMTEAELFKLDDGSNHETEEELDNVVLEEIELSEDDVDVVTTDTLTLENEDINPENNELAEQSAAAQADDADISDEDDIDYSKLFTSKPEEKKKKVSNRKRKKTMKSLSSENKAQMDKLGLNSMSKKKKTEENKKDKSFKPTSMSPAISFGLSLRNLWSKKARTFFTAFASSIGIIGLGLVLSISNGFGIYVNKMQTEMMAGMPLGVYEYNVEASMISKMTGMLTTLGEDLYNYPEGDDLTVDLQSSTAGGTLIDMATKIISSFLGEVSENNISEEFVEHINGIADAVEDGDDMAVSTYYGLRYNLVNKTVDEQGNTLYKDVSQQPPVSSVMSIAMTIFGQQGLQPTYWQMLVGKESNMLEYYDLIGENSHYPQAANELLLSVNGNNMLDLAMLDELGITVYETDENGDYVKDSNGKIQAKSNITVDDLIGKTIKLVYNDDYYAPAKTSDGYTFSKFQNDSGIANGWKYDNQTTLDNLYNNGEGIELKIVGILRPKKGTSADYVSSAICYTPELQELVLNNAYNSQIAKAQQDIGVELRHDADGNVIATPITFVNAGGVNLTLTDGELQATADNVFGVLSVQKDYTSFLRAIGAIKRPSYINVYPLNYTQKVEAGNYIKNWTGTDGSKIGYLDVSEMIIYQLNMILDLVTILLVAVASISLVVSTAMIGVITSNSVIERIREIGILRALGARKKDIRNVFVAETTILGLFGGIMGIVITYILCPIISAVIGIFASGVSGLLQFNPLHALLLVALSLVLTIISGVVPAIMASRKNVVDALRVN